MLNAVHRVHHGHGRDLDGRIVPNEAYFFTIEAEAPGLAPAIYDPVTFSGGDYGDITRGELSHEMGTFDYKLGQPSRVRLRVGIQGSAITVPSRCPAPSSFS